MLFSKRTILGALFTGTLAARSDPCQKLANSFAPRSNTSDLIVNIANLAPEGSSFEGNSLGTIPRCSILRIDD
jgi:hypothetical protein